MTFTLVLIKPSLHGVNVAQQIHHEALKKSARKSYIPLFSYELMVTESAHLLFSLLNTCYVLGPQMCSLLSVE